MCTYFRVKARHYIRRPRVCIEYAKRINELQTIARKSSLADLLRYICTYSKETAVDLGTSRLTKFVVANNKKRDNLVLQLTKNMMVTASTALDPIEAAKLAGKYTPDYVRKLMDWTFWLKLPGLATSDALQNVPFGAMMDKYLKVFYNEYGARAARGIPGLNESDSAPVVLNFVRDESFNPDCVFPVNKRVESIYISLIDRLKIIFEGKHPTSKVKLNAEHATDELAKDIRGRLSAFMIAYAAAYAFGISNVLPQEPLCELVVSTFTACLGIALSEGYEPATLLQGVEQVEVFLEDVKFFCDLKSQENLRLRPNTEQPDVDLAALLGDGEYAFAVFLAALPLIRTGQLSCQ